MSPDNLPCVAVARPDVCALANNHVLDFGQRGLRETLASLADAGLAAAGVGLHKAQATARSSAIAAASPSSPSSRHFAWCPE